MKLRRLLTITATFLIAAGAIGGAYILQKQSTSPENEKAAEASLDCPAGYTPVGCTCLAGGTQPHQLCVVTDNQTNVISMVCGGSNSCTTGTTTPSTSADNASMTDQTGQQLLKPGAVTSITITMKNQGTTTWSKQAGYKLVSQHPLGNNIWGVSEILLADADQVQPGASKIFTFSIQAPTVAGNYEFQWQMAKGSAVFGTATADILIKVDASSAVQPVTCGLADVNTDGKFTLPDFIAFAQVYQAPCSDIPPTSDCGAKDTNHDGKVDIIDFISFSSRYNKPSCLP